MFKAKDIMSTPVVWVPASRGLTDTVKLMVEKDIGCVIVGSENVFLPLEKLGIITERDITRLIAEGRDLNALKVSDVMSPKLITVSLESDLTEISEKMGKHNIRHLSVFDGKRVVGIITSKDVTRALRYSKAKWMIEYRSDKEL